MNSQDFQDSLKERNPPTEWTNTLIALWYDGKEDWQAAHELVDGQNDEHSKWIHAYLHRKEGDDWNAGYWYRQAGKPFPEISLKEEHQTLVAALCSTL